MRVRERKYGFWNRSCCKTICVALSKKKRLVRLINNRFCRFWPPFITGKRGERCTAQYYAIVYVLWNSAILRVVVLGLCLEFRALWKNRLKISGFAFISGQLRVFPNRQHEIKHFPSSHYLCFDNDWSKVNLYSWTKVVLLPYNIQLWKLHPEQNRFERK